jgi:C4-dicarboxylate-binding protein DctP
MGIIRALLVLSFLTFLLTACEQTSSQKPKKTNNQPVILSLGHDLSTESPQHLAALNFSEEVDKQSNGQLKIEIFADQTLGTDRQMLALAQQGKLDIALPPTAKLSHLIPSLQVFDLPFLFPDAKTAHMALDGKAGNMLLSKFSQHKLIGITFWESGFKQLTSNKPIQSIDDFKNHKFRIMESSVIRDQFASWGAESIAIDFGHTYQALKDRVADGQENPLNSIVDKKFYQVQDHLYMSNHGYLAQALVVSEKTYNKLSTRHKKILIDSAKATTEMQRILSEKKNYELEVFLTNQKIKVQPLPPAIRQELIYRSKDILEKHRMQFGTEIIEEVLQIVEQERQFQENELVIAIDADMSGNSALSGLAIKRGVQLAVEEINLSGGVLGKNLVITARDNSMIPARGLDNLKKFSKIDNLVAVFGGISSPVVLEELEFIHTHNLLMLVPWAAATGIVENGYNPNRVFRVSVRDEYAAEFLLSNALKVSPRVGLLLVDNPWGRSNHKALIESLNAKQLTPTGTEWFEWGNSDFSDKINKLYDRGTKVIIYVGNPVEAAKIVQQISQQEESIPIISHWGITGGYFPKLAGEALDKVDLRVLQTFSFINNNTPKAKSLIEKYKKKYSIADANEIVAPVGTAHAYDLTHMLAKAIKKAGTTNPNEIRVALENIEYHAGLVRDYKPPFSSKRHDALELKDFILTKYQNGILIPIDVN